jgi:hypothetical protein
MMRTRSPTLNGVMCAASRRAPAIASTCFCAAATILQVMPLLGKDLDLLIPDGEIAKPSEKH